MLERLTCNLFQSQNCANGSSGNVLERRTVQSTHISTISSLVDRSLCRDNTQQMHESQKENFGLYALKYNRSAASKRNSVFRILTPGGGSPLRKYSSTSSNIAYNFRHEQFQPCQTIDDNGNNDDDDDETTKRMVAMSEQKTSGYYKIEFSDDDGLDETPNACKNFKENLNNRIKQNECDDTNRTQMSTAPHPPKRVRNVPVRSKPVENRKQILANESLARRQSSPKPSKQMNYKNSAKYAHVTQSNEMSQNDCGNKLPFTAKKNKSELYRIVEMEKYSNDENGNGTATRAATMRTQYSLQKRSNSRDSVDIFKRTDAENAFDDFDEAIHIEPIQRIDRGMCNSRNESDENDRKTVNISTDSDEIRIYTYDKNDENDENVIIV